MDSVIVAYAVEAIDVWLAHLPPGRDRLGHLDESGFEKLRAVNGITRDLGTARARATLARRIVAWFYGVSEDTLERRLRPQAVAVGRSHWEMYFRALDEALENGLGRTTISSEHGACTVSVYEMPKGYVTDSSRRQVRGIR